jgi:hypothetical protein
MQFRLAHIMVYRVIGKIGRKLGLFSNTHLARKNQRENSKVFPCRGCIYVQNNVWETRMNWSPCRYDSMEVSSWSAQAIQRPTNHLSRSLPQSRYKDFRRCLKVFNNVHGCSLFVDLCGYLWTFVNLWSTGFPLQVLYHFVQFGSHASRTPPKSLNVTDVTELWTKCRNHLEIQKNKPVKCAKNEISPW